MSKVALDAADIRILCAVQKHGRLSKAKLAEQVALSPTPCWTRLTRLEKQVRSGMKAPGLSTSSISCSMRSP